MEWKNFFLKVASVFAFVCMLSGVESMSLEIYILQLVVGSEKKPVQIHLE